MVIILSKNDDENTVLSRNKSEATMDQELIQVAQVGDRNRVEHLLRQGADIHAQNDRALRDEAFWGHGPFTP